MWDGETDVWRVEFRFKREALHELKTVDHGKATGLLQQTLPPVLCIKLRAGRIRLIARIERASMVGAQRLRLSVPRRSDERLVVNCHRYGFAHADICTQNRIMEVEVHGLEVRGIGIGRKFVAG